MTPHVCNLIIPGAAKSGTSALHDMLDTHLEIRMSRRKEPHYFCRDEKYQRGPEWHNSLFEDISEEKIFGESSTGYMCWPKAIERIANDLSEPKAILLLRHPVERTFSHWRWRVRLGLEKRSLKQAVCEDGFGYDPANPDRFGYMAYLQFSQYSKYVPMWLDALGNDRCLLVSSANLRSTPEKTMERCFKFLEIKSSLRVNECSANETERLGIRPTKMMTRFAALLPRRMRHFQMYKSFRGSVLRFLAPPVPKEMTPDERKLLEDELADDIEWFDSRVKIPSLGGHQETS